MDDYNRLYFCELGYFNSYFSEMNLKSKTLKCEFYSNLFYKGDDFLALVKFNELYNDGLKNYPEVIYYW